ncbi:DUF2066 domain-containing protein [uncultured Ferrimonas sp.]|uniref:DUF2066 domain-containing protein n=1 Tax=uncultured Ferrimonas sp. TaxID=432640 RepID=UPI0026116F7E|nr:DUF2066 domain-containing protein [uncultured Ferrimonas sp.]
MRAALLLFLSLFSLLANAVQVTQLYRGDVTVEARDNRARSAGVKAALAQVLVRITGDDSIASQPQGKALLRQADSFMLTYSFQSGEPLRLQARFDATKLQQQMRQLGLPIWGAQRPTTLHWAAIEQTDGQLRLLSDADELGEKVAAHAEQRGLPQLLPLLDLEDSMKADVNDVRGNFPKLVLEASQRYGSDFVLLSSIEPIAEQWQYHLHLYSGAVASDPFAVARTLLQGSGEAATEAEALDQVIAKVALYFSLRYGAIASEQSGQTQLHFTLTGGIAALVELERYLTSLAPVKATKVVAVTGQEIQIELDLIGGLAEVEQLMTLEQRLTKLEVVDQLDERTHYLWQQP